MNLISSAEDLASITQDKWTKVRPTFGVENQFTVVGYIRLENQNKLYVGHCSECSKDSELFGEVYFGGYRGHLKNGYLPCGCAKHPRWDKVQYQILLERKALELGYSFIGFGKEWDKQRTKITLNCSKHGDWSTGTIDRLLNLSQGCPICKGMKIGERSSKPDSEIIESFNKTGAFHMHTNFWKSERLDSRGCLTYWNFSCPDCGGLGESSAGNLQAGKKSCACSAFRQKTAYIIVLYKDEEPIALKFGVANSVKARLEALNRSSLFKIVNIAIYEFQDKQSCLSTERRCKNELLCGVVGKDQMPDGWSETTDLINLERLHEIFSESGIRIY